MDLFWEVFLEALKCAAHGESLNWCGQRESAFWRRFYKEGQNHNILPLIVHAVWDSKSLAASSDFKKLLGNRARDLTFFQAQRTADFQLLYLFLLKRGLRPALLKGMVCQNLYPIPDQRASVDEDLLICPEEFPKYHQALLDFGLTLVNPEEDIEKAYEVAYNSIDSHLYIEIHKLPFSPDSEAYSELNRLFGNVMERTVIIPVNGICIHTIDPTDHLLYLICHAYKHFLHSGVGIRQSCDIGMFAERYYTDVDWERILEDCRQYNIAVFAAAVFSINMKYLGFEMPDAFADIDVDELPLLQDMLSGGLYGAADTDRLHSSNMTLSAVSAQKKKRKTIGLFRSVFLPRKSMQVRYTFLRRHGWLLPAAWIHRVWHYLRHRSNHPSASIRLGKSRVELLKKYGII